MSQEVLHVGNMVPLAKRMILKLKVFGTEKWDCRLCTGHYFSYGTFPLTTTVTMLSIAFFWGIESCACQSTSAAARPFMYLLVCDRCTEGKGLLWSQAARAEWCTHETWAPFLALSFSASNCTGQVSFLSSLPPKWNRWAVSASSPCYMRVKHILMKTPPGQITMRATGS